MDFLSITHLLYTFIGVIIIICAVIVLTIALKKETVLKADSPGEDRKSLTQKKFSLAELLNTRIYSGPRASEDYAHQYTKQLIDRRVSMECAPSDCAEETEDLRKTCKQLIDYKQLSESDSSIEPPDIPPLFSLLKTFHSSGSVPESRPNPPIHDCLIQLSEVLRDENLGVTLKVLTRYDGSFHYSPKLNKYCNKQFDILIEALSELVGSIKKANGLIVSAEQKDRQFAVKKSLNAFRKALDHVASALQGRSSKVLEATYLELLLKQMIEIAKKADFDESWRPRFEVRFLSDEDQLEVNNRFLNLAFRIVNSNHHQLPLKKGNPIRVQIISLSNDLQPSGEIHSFDLSSGKVEFSVNFRSFALDTAESNTKPKIQFHITYRIMAKDESVQKTIELPPIVVHKKVTNPFKEGAAGKALSGDSTLFTGRIGLLSGLSREMTDFKNTPLYYLLHGSPRSGKTSIVKQLAYNPKWLKGRFIPIWMSGEYIDNPDSFYEWLFDSIKEKLRDDLSIHLKPLEEKKRFKEKPWLRIVELLRLNNKEITKTQKRLLLVIDEYQQLAVWDKFEDKKQEKILATKVPYQFPEFVKVIRDGYDRLMTIVMDGQLSLEDIRRSGAQGERWVQLLGGRITQKDITNLSSKEADELLTRQFSMYDINIHPEILLRARMYTVCHPWLHMLLAYHLFERMIDESGYTLRSDTEVRKNDVDQAALKITGADIKFAWVEPWLIRNNAARIFLAALGERSYRTAKDNNRLPEMPELTVEDVNDFLHYNTGLKPGQFNFNDIIPKLIGKNLIVEAEDRSKFKLYYPLYAVFAHQTGQIHEILNKEMA